MIVDTNLVFIYLFAKKRALVVKTTLASKDRGSVVTKQR